jgi:hypothetical protein
MASIEIITGNSEISTGEILSTPDALEATNYFEFTGKV